MASPAPTKPLHVICVDDEGQILEIYAKIAADVGLVPLCASSGERALELLALHHRSTALVVSDYQMPDMHGLDLRARMLPDYAQVPFVLISGHISREDALRSIDLRIAGFAEKPFTEEGLERLIRERSTERAAQLRDEAELIDGFVADAESLIEEIEGLLLTLEAQPSNVDTVNRIFAIAHTIKGASGFFQPKTIHRFTHAYEDFLSPYKKSAQPVPPEAISVLLKGLDVIKSLLPPLRDGSPEPAPLEELLAVLEIQPGAPLRAAHGPAKAGDGAKAASSAPQPRDEIRVPIAILDEFMELSGEITVIRNMINKLVRTIEKDIPGNRGVSLLSELLDEMHKINAQMQEKIVDLRKVSCKHIFRPLKRAVRDLAGILKKDIDLQTAGDEMRVDTSIAEILGNSLIHMVRNCVDHGIEDPGSRASALKPRTGSIVIEAAERNQEVIVTILDDGRGIDPEVIRRKAVEKKMLSEEKAQALTVKELQALIFDSGFSTAAQVTDVSGRGVGMDMVMKAVTGGGGRIEIDSVMGKGTTFQLIIPVPKTVTIISSLLVRSGDHVLALPQENLLRLISIPPASRKEMLRSPQGADLLLVSGELFPVVNLKAMLTGDAADMFRLPDSADAAQFALVTSDHGRFAILVDDIHDAEDIVVKKLGRDLQSLSLFRGATFLGDGKVGLILNISGLAKHAGVAGRQPEAGDTAERRGASHLEEKKPLRNLLLLRLEHPSLFGIFLDDIFRLESIRRSDIQRSGDIPMIVYRGEACPLVEVDELLGYGSAPDEAEMPLDVPALVLFTAQGFFAVRVKGIVDLVPTDAEVDTELSDRRGVQGALLHDGRTVTVLDGKGLLALAEAKRVRGAPEPREGETEAA